MKEIMRVKGLKPRGHYALALIHDGLIFISGQLSKDPETGENRPGSMKEETMRALNNVDLILRECGSSRDKVLKTTAFVGSQDDWAAVNQCYAEFFGTHHPARSIVPVGALNASLKVEIEVIAAVE